MTQPLLKLRILLSYWYYKNVDLDAFFERYFAGHYPDVFADSGAFSAFTQGSEIDLTAYADWVKRYRHLFTVHANLDVIHDAVGTLHNQKRLEDLGLTPLPVFHAGEPWSYLERYIEQYPYIALGGIAASTRLSGRVMPWLIQCFKLAQGQAVYHGFAATSWKIMSAFPWYSVDSSSWGKGFRYGKVPLFDQRRGCFMEVPLGDYPAALKYQHLIRALGFEPLDFADRALNDRSKICAISALSYMMAERWLRQRHGDIYIPGQTLSGQGIYLVDSNKQHLADAQSGIGLYLADARGKSGGDLAAAETGLKIHLADTTPLDHYGPGKAALLLNERSNRQKD